MFRPLSNQPFGPEDYTHEEATSWDQPTPDPITRLLPRLGQLGPAAQQRLLAQAGRSLAGADGANEMNKSTDLQDENGTDPLLYEMERDDDTYGSGIFDPSRRLPTINRDLGIFGENYNIPGWLGRETQFAVSDEIADISTGADMVFVPGGGMTLPEKGGYETYYERFAPTPPQPPHMRPPPVSRRTDTYVSLTASAKPVPAGASTTKGPVEVPTIVRRTNVPMRDISTGGDPGVSATNPRPVRRVPTNMRQTPVGMRSNIGLPYKPLPAAGLGADTSQVGWGTYAAAGAMIGAAAFIFWGAVSGHAARPNRRRRR